MQYFKSINCFNSRCDFITSILNSYSNSSFRRKTATWCSTVAGILSSGCPQFFKSGTKEFNKEPGWWGLQQTIAPAIKFSEAGLEVF